MKYGVRWSVQGFEPQRYGLGLASPDHAELGFIRAVVGVKSARPQNLLYDTVQGGKNVVGLDFAASVTGSRSPLWSTVAVGRGCRAPRAEPEPRRCRNADPERADAQAVWPPPKSGGDWIQLLHSPRPWSRKHSIHCLPAYLLYLIICSSPSTCCPDLSLVPWSSRSCGEVYFVCSLAATKTRHPRTLSTPTCESLFESRATAVRRPGTATNSSVGDLLDGNMRQQATNK